MSDELGDEQVAHLNLVVRERHLLARLDAGNLLSRETRFADLFALAVEHYDGHVLLHDQ
jgi:hypothetical protein